VLEGAPSLEGASAPEHPEEVVHHLSGRGLNERRDNRLPKFRTIIRGSAVIGVLLGLPIRHDDHLLADDAYETTLASLGQPARR